VKLAKVSATDKGAAPSLNLVFDGSGKPERVDSYGADVHSAEQAILNASFPVIFPEQSSVKVVREGALVCRDSGCSIELKSAGFNPDALNPNATVTASKPSAPNAGASK
jgi:hypothetical protein